MSTTTTTQQVIAAPDEVGEREATREERAVKAQRFVGQKVRVTAAPDQSSADWFTRGQDRTIATVESVDTGDSLRTILVSIAPEGVNHWVYDVEPLLHVSYSPVTGLPFVTVTRDSHPGVFRNVPNSVIEAAVYPTLIDQRDQMRLVTYAYSGSAGVTLTEQTFVAASFPEEARPLIGQKYVWLYQTDAGEFIQAVEAAEAAKEVTEVVTFVVGDPVMVADEPASTRVGYEPAGYVSPTFSGARGKVWRILDDNKYEVRLADGSANIIHGDWLTKAEPTEEEQLKAALEELRAEKNQLQQQLSEQSEQHEAFKKRVGQVAMTYARRNDWCDEVKRALGEVDIELPTQRVRFEVTATWVMEATSEDKGFDQDGFIQSSITGIEDGQPEMDGDWEDVQVVHYPSSYVVSNVTQVDAD